MDIQRADLKQKKRRKQIALGAIAAAVVLLGTLGLSQLEPAAPSVEQSTVWLDTVKRGEMLREVRGPGTLVPKAIRWLAADTNARVERIVVKPGAVVEPDTVILELSNPEVDEQLLAARTLVAAAEADLVARRVDLEGGLLTQRGALAQVEADYEGARLQAQAEAELNKKGIISDLQYRQTQLRADQLKIRVGLEKDRVAKFNENIAAQVRAEGSRIEQLRNTLALRERQADSLKLKAGIAGVLQQVPVEEGQQVMAGTNLARVAKPDVLMAELRIAETQAKDIVIGQTVRVDTRIGPNGIVPGKVMRIDPAVLNGTVQVDVDFDAPLPPGARPDLSVDGVVEIERLADVLYVGRPAFGQPGAQATIFRLDPESNVAHRVPVKLGRASVSLIEIEQGLKQGDRVILSDTSQWDEHDRIKLN
ncbi:MAG TPA: HlyD family efflux transporter periplasmic adaptor subunit [Xanthomonadales bacterium]|nr:HlyD family efflux transporter periplasmic adaptor subunit [Xanthomonadales bacterium]